MKLLSKNVSDNKADGSPLIRLSLVSSSSGSSPQMIRTTTKVSPTTPENEVKKVNPFTRFGAKASDDHKWNPFSDKSSVVTPSPKQSRLKKEVTKFQSLADLTSYLTRNSNSFLPSHAVKGYCQQIVAFMKEDEDNTEIHMQGGRALFLLSLQDRTDREGESSTKGGVESLLSAMEYFSDDALLQSQSCLALESLLAWEENQTIVLSKRGQVEVFYSALESFPEDTELIVAALGALYNLSCNPDAVEDSIAKDLAYAIPPILNLLKENRDHVDFYERGLSTLAKLTEDNPASQLLFCQDGQLGIRVAVNALHNERFSDRPKIQLAAVLILQHVASHSSLECKAKIVMHGGLDRILHTLQQHCYPLFRPADKRSVSAPIMASALHTLANLSSSKLNGHDKTRQEMGKAVPIILRILKKHHNLPQIQLSGYTALKNVADIHANLVTRNGGVAIIMKSLAQQINDPAVQKQACRTLVQLFSKQQSDAMSTNNILSGESNPSAAVALDLVRSVAEEDGIEIIFRTVRMHQARRPVLEPAIEALHYLSCSRNLTPQQKQQLCLEENVVVTLGSIRNFTESEPICESGCGLVLNMSFFAPSKQDNMATVGGVQTVLSAMRRHGLNAKIQEYGCGILSGLCLNPATHNEFMDEEGISTVLSAMVVHPYQPGVQAFGCDVLLSISSVSSNQKKLVMEANAKQVASDAMIRHKKHGGVQNRGSALLKALA
ncbi:hypothetical protein IV203_015768 [Nitzschia inconspicua]|uniref:LRRK2 ARM repeat domain-containing protein n=1 Tax=Nitzschia inconspicua TaxID=303405 RepID=A0A9K3LBD4_9STRA|nr:hypothetical protein IV203_015768 [Nitzschia inconspicua]